LSGTAAEITAVRSVDRIDVGTGRVGPVEKMMQEGFAAVIRGENGKSKMVIYYLIIESSYVEKGMVTFSFYIMRICVFHVKKRR